jgi:DNA-binding MarR family transcriptional regulator
MNTISISGEVDDTIDVRDIIAEFDSSISELRCAGSQQLVRAGVSMAHLHVMWLLKRHGDLSMGRLAEMLDVSLSNASGLIDRMAERGLVERIRVPDDRRLVLVALSDHGSQMLDYIGELDGVTQPVCIIWGDQDHRAPPPVLDAYRPLPARMKNVEVHIFPGVQHGYMMPGNPKAFDRATREFSMQRAVAILDGLRGGEPMRKAS